MQGPTDGPLGFKEKIKELELRIKRNNDLDDVMLKDQFSTTEELAYHMEILDEPTTPLLDKKPKIKRGDPQNLKIPCVIGTVYTGHAYIDLESPANIISRAYYNKIQAKGLLLDFMALENLSFVIEDRLSEVVFGKPFLMTSKLEYNLTNGRIRDKLKAVLSKGEEDVKKGIDHIFSKRKGYYMACLNLGREYKKDEETLRRLMDITNLESLGANGDVLEAFRGISRQLDEVQMESGHEDTDFLKTTKTS
ncbi:hypothetical protein Tco_0514453 [Tanacetum coccineum]